MRTGGSSAATQPCQPHGQQGAALPTSGPGTAAKDLCKNRQNVVYNGTFALQQGLSCRRGPPGFFPHNSCWVSPFPTALPPPRSGNDLRLHPRRRRPVRGAQAGRGGRAAPLHLGLARPGRQRGQRGSATRRPHGTVPAPTFSPGLPLSPLGPCKGKGGGVSADGDGAGGSASVPRGWWARGRAGGTLLPAVRGSPPGRGGRPRRARQRPPGRRSMGTGRDAGTAPPRCPQISPLRHPAPTLGPGTPGCPGLPTSPLIPGSPGTPCRTHGRGDKGT